MSDERMTDILAFEHVTRAYPRGPLALDDVSVAIAAGEFVAIVGPSGSGKSTLLHLAAGLDRPDSGRVIVDGVDTTVISERERIRLRREKIGLVFQSFYTVPYLSAVENVMLAQDLHSLVDEKEAREVLGRVGLAARADALPSQLSGGELQRVCIARALVNRPRLLLADEPTGNLDEDNENLVLGLFQELHREGQAIIMVTHDLTVARLADRRLTLEHGRVVGSFVTPAEAEEAMDEALERIWILRERGEVGIERLISGPHGAPTTLLRRMSDRALITHAGETVELTPAGFERAQNLIRRQRLAEMLFTHTLGLDAKVTEREACRFEHILSLEVTDSICAFLKHPRACPHGAQIPRGVCCQ
jgi:putative ABC transport system ATP-binding protein